MPDAHPPRITYGRETSAFVDGMRRVRRRWHRSVTRIVVGSLTRIRR